MIKFLKVFFLVNQFQPKSSITLYCKVFIHTICIHAIYTIVNNPLSDILYSPYWVSPTTTRVHTRDILSITIVCICIITWYQQPFLFVLLVSLLIAQYYIIYYSIIIYIIICNQIYIIYILRAIVYILYIYYTIYIYTIVQYYQ